MPSLRYSPGHVGVVTKSGSLSYQVCRRLTQAAIGQSTVVGIAGDPIKGATTREALDLFYYDHATAGTVVLGEIGGMDEYDVCSYAERAGAKRLVAFFVGRRLRRTESSATQVARRYKRSGVCGEGVRCGAIRRAGCRGLPRDWSG